MPVALPPRPAEHVAAPPASQTERSVNWHLGTQRRQSLAVGVVAVVGSLALARLVMQFEFLPMVFLIMWAVLVGIAWQPRVGLYVAFGLILVFETYSPDPLMLPGYYLFGTGVGTGIQLAGTLVTPLELLLVLMFGAWLARGMMRRQLDFRGGRLGRPMALFSITLLVGLAWGIANGGDPYIAFWESRYLFYVGICYVVAANTVRTRRHIRVLMTLALVGMGAFALEGVYRQLALIETKQLGVAPEFAWEHSDVIFLGSLLLLVLAQWANHAPAWQRLFGLMLVPIAGYTLLATERRAGYIAVMVAFLIFTLVFFTAYRKTFWAVAVPVLVVGAIYLPVFWNATGMLGQPARAVRSLSQPDERDAASNLYRDLEKLNVEATIKANPLLGVGFGREFMFVVPLPDLSWWSFWHYEPHHNILWVWLKTGAIGFTLFWVIMGSAMMRAAAVARANAWPELRVWALFSLAGLVSTAVFCYVDLGLTSSRVTVFLGTILGTLSVLDQVTE